MIKLNKNRHGEYLLTFTWPISKSTIVGLLGRAVRKSNTLLGWVLARTIVISGGLGLGFGMALSGVVLERPYVASANQQLETYQIESSVTSPYRALRFPGSADSGSIQSFTGQLSNGWQLSSHVQSLKLTDFAAATRSSLILVGARSYWFRPLSQAQLGTILELQGSHGGWFQAEIIEKKELSVLHLSQLLHDDERTVFIALPNLSQPAMATVLVGVVK